MDEQQELFDRLTTDTSITTEDLDVMVSVMAKSKKEYEQRKAKSDEAHAIYQEKRAKLVSTLQACNKKKYSVDGIGTVSVTEKLKVRTPKGLEAKKELAAWLKQQLGDDGMHTYLSVNYNSLNSLYNQEFEHAKDRGQGGDFYIPGIEKPEAEFGLSFRK